jgi:hypothetical protein
MPLDTPKVTKEDLIYSNTLSINNSLKELCKNQTESNRNNKQLFLGLLGVIGAMIGREFAGTPIYVDISIMLCLIAGIFLLGSLVFWWKYYVISQKVVRVVFSTLMVSSSITQIWVYRPGEAPAPGWFVPMIQGLLIATALSLIWVGWAQKPKNGKEHCT